MSIRTFRISPLEWETALDAVLAAQPSETDHHQGVALVATDGVRAWSAWSRELAVTTRPFYDEGLEDITVALPRRLIEFAVALSHACDAYLTVGDDHITVQGDQGQMRVGHPLVSHVLEVDWNGNQLAGAQLSLWALEGLFAAGQIVPAGVDLDGVDAPPFVVSITHDAVAAEVDWRIGGAPATRLAMAAHTTGMATRAIWPAATARLLRTAAGAATVEIAMPADRNLILLRTDDWCAAVPALEPAEDVEQELARTGPQEMLGQLRLFDLVSPERDVAFDPLAGWSLGDVRALAIDPDPEVRIAVAASRWTWDLGVQEVLASDPEVRVVLALLDHVDPSREVCEVIIDGPHVEARQVLASRPLSTALLERLVANDDPATSADAAAVLARRNGTVIEPIASDR